MQSHLLISPSFIPVAKYPSNSGLTHIYLYILYPFNKRTLPHRFADSYVLNKCKPSPFTLEGKLVDKLITLRYLIALRRVAHARWWGLSGSFMPLSAAEYSGENSTSGGNSVAVFG